MSAAEVPPESPAPARPGALLRAAREAQGRSAQDVARSLCLSLRQIEALEADDFGALPGDTFVRGFIRNYAKLLGIDARPVLAAYEAIKPQPVPESAPPRADIELSPRRLRRGIFVLGGVATALVVLPLALYWVLSGGGEAPAPVPKTALGVAVGPLPLPPPAATAGAPAAAERASPSAAIPAPAGASPGTPPEVTMAPELTFAFDEDAWVEVRDGRGRKLLSQLMRAGSEQTVRGEKPFKIVVGNARHVRLTYNGKPVDLAPYVKVDVARLTLE